MPHNRPSWSQFVVTTVLVIVSGLAGIFVFIAAVNPYGNLPVSLPFPYHRVTGNERYAFPGLLKRKSYDSAVFGTSTAMLLHPRDLNEKLGGRFINLSMASGTPWEQMQVFDLFRRDRTVKTVLIAIDVVWCNPRQPEPRLTFRPYPPWMYDANPWNDYLHLLNDRAVIHAARLATIWLGLTRPPFGRDGYFQFVPDTSEYNLARARENIYGRAVREQTKFPDLETLRASERIVADAAYPDLATLFGELDKLKPGSNAILFFAPYHAIQFSAPERWSRWQSCKRRVVGEAAKRNFVTVVDFMRPSPLTTRDENYWDPLHYTVERSRDVVASLALGVSGVDRGEIFEVLFRPGRKK